MSTSTSQPSSVANPVASLTQFGQSVWLDFIRRSLIAGGELKRLVDEDSLGGVTSNPAIFEKAIDGSNDYAAAIHEISRSPRLSGPRRSTSSWPSRTFRTPPTYCAAFTTERRHTTVT